MDETKTAAELIAEIYSSPDRLAVVYCDAGNGCRFGEGGEVIDYDADRHGALVMRATLPHMSNDRAECVWASDWQTDDRFPGYRWQIRI